MQKIQFCNWQCMGNAMEALLNPPPFNFQCRLNPKKRTLVLFLKKSLQCAKVSGIINMCVMYCGYTQYG